MNRKKTTRTSLAVRNSAVGLVSQIIAVIFQLVTRSIFVQYLGVELLGISSTFSSVLNTLSLTELGFQTAVIYSLYKPLAESDEEKINDIVNVLKTIYRCIGIFFIIAGIVCLPFIKLILSEVDVTLEIYIIFIIQVINSASSYFLAYKRSLLFADRREFISKVVDTTLNVTINLIKIYVVIKTSNYILYISLTTLQTITTNLIIHLISWKIYPFLHKTKFNFELFKTIWGNVKNLFAAKIAYYIYSSTDNIVVSTIVSTVSVGYMVNYTTITSNLKTLANSIFNPITPIIGNMVAEKDNHVDEEYICRVYTYVRYIIACLIIIPMIILIQDFIVAWVGEQYLLSTFIVWLYGLDLYVFFVQGPLCDFINTNGLFKDERNIEILGAVCNIVSSVFLAHILGIAGVLIGTVFSQMVFWIGRSIIAYKKCFHSSKKAYAMYWVKNAVYFMLFVLCTVILGSIYRIIPIRIVAVKFICGGIMCEIILFAIMFICFRYTQEQKYLITVLKHLIEKRFKKTSNI